MYMSISDIDAQCPRGFNRSKVTEHEWQTAPFSNECLMDFFQRMNAHLRRYYDWEEMIYTILYFIISISALIGNGVVILAVIRKKEMRTNRNVLIVNLALSNLVLALTTIPFLWWPSIDFEFPYSKFFCKFANALPGSNIYCSTLTISIMAVDRYYSVKRMSAHHMERAQCLRTILVSLAIWITSFALSFPLIVYYDTTMLYVLKDVMVYEPTKSLINNTAIMKSFGWRQCRLSPNGGSMNSSLLNARTIQLVMSFMQVLFLYVVPLVVLSIFNVKLTRFLRLNAQQVNKFRRETIPHESHLTIDEHKNKNGHDHSINNYCLLNGHNGDNCNSEQMWSIDSTPVNRLSKAPSSTTISLSNNSNNQNRSSQQNKLKNSTRLERAAKRRRNRTTALLVAMACSYAVLWFPFTLVSVLIDLEILIIVCFEIFHRSTIQSR